MNRRNKVILIVILLVLTITPLIGYIMASSSDPFQHSKNVIDNSSALKEIVGDIKSVKLSPFGYSVKYIGSHGWAEFEVNVVGTKNSGVLFIKLEKDLGIWNVLGANLNQKDIKL